MPYGYYSYGYGAGLNTSYILLAVVSLILGLATQSYIKKTYRKWSSVRASLPGSGAEVARRMLDEGGASNIGIDRIAGELSDNFNPSDGRLHLSSANFSGASVASVAVACHEAGHAVQAQKGFSMYRLRRSLAPVVNFASNAWMAVLMIGVFMNVMGLVKVAIFLFADRRVLLGHAAGRNRRVPPCCGVPRKVWIRARPEGCPTGPHRCRAHLRGGCAGLHPSACVPARPVWR